ncbi:hypothetical protein D5S18_10745 [Nocardia panacis]|uniref:DUF4878 domain-containing protein n=1 Tax=Nocardia panacis TaxID=2340916 RepID=A0A3A4KDD1_9NOCA|nr:hypothetical protein [Nocardia panacis]RJO76731.1 hypothetical protein D5S18_10745 [Nocardia panacis]
MAAPQKIEPPQDGVEKEPSAARSKRWVWLVAGAAALVVVLGVVVVTLVTRGGGDSAEAKVRGAIGDYTAALGKGNLAALQQTTCGPLHDFYKGIPPEQFAKVYRLSVDRKNIPIVDNVDTVRITDNKAIAQAVVYTDADPSKRTARTFDLQRTQDGWKVCDPSSAAK